MLGCALRSPAPADGYTDGVQHGFRRDARGLFTTIDVPGTAGTHLNKRNDRGQFVGRYYQTFQPGGGAPFRGLLLDGGRLVRIDGPGGRQAQALGINNRGQVVGEYQTPDGRYHGFRWEHGRITTIDTPGAAGTSLVDINDVARSSVPAWSPTGPAAGSCWTGGRSPPSAPRGSPSPSPATSTTAASSWAELVQERADHDHGSQQRQDRHGRCHRTAPGVPALTGN